MRYYLIAGEPSGDLHGANLMRGILKADADAVFRFWGGDMMAAAGGAQNLAKHYRDTSFFGIAEVVRNLPTILGQFGECRRDIERFAPDVLILIDYPGFNLRMARFAHERGIPVFYYIAPKVWAWKEWRVRQLRRYVDRLYTIFPFEGEYFRSKGIEPHFAGNPLADAIAARRPSFPSPGQFRRDHGLDSRPIVALLAGSRRSEIRANLKFMAHIARRMPDRQFVVAGVSWIERAEYDRMTRDMPVATVCDATYELLSISEAAVVTSGTATLETALLGIPELVVGFQAGRARVQHTPPPAAAAPELRAIRPGGARRESMLRDFDRLREMMGREGVSDRVAADMVAALRTQKTSGKR